MSTKVSQAVAGLGETLATDGALVWLVSCVLPHMLSQTVGNGKGHGTLCALVRFLTRVDADVKLQAGGLGESFAAVLTLVWPDACVVVDMLLVVAHIRERLATDGACVRLLSRAGTDVDAEVARAHKRLAAVGTEVGSVAAVCAQVGLVGAAEGEARATDIALERSFTRV